MSLKQRALYDYGHNYDLSKSSTGTRSEERIDLAGKLCCAFSALNLCADFCTTATGLQSEKSLKKLTIGHCKSAVHWTAIDRASPSCSKSI